MGTVEAMGRRHDPGSLGTNGQRYVEAKLDVVSFDPAMVQHYYIDTTVRNALCTRYLQAGSADNPGVAMRLASEEKSRRYPDKDGLHCTTASVEQHGLIGEEFLQLLELLAGQASANDASHARPACHWLRRWLRQISVSTALVQASAIVCAAGARGADGSVVAARVLGLPKV